jgi:hypothetical protein
VRPSARWYWCILPVCQGRYQLNTEARVPVVSWAVLLGQKHPNVNVLIKPSHTPTRWEGGAECTSNAGKDSVLADLAIDKGKLGPNGVRRKVYRIFSRPRPCSIIQHTVRIARTVAAFGLSRIIAPLFSLITHHEKGTQSVRLTCWR